jgi:PAS domain S-box-containing protein
MKKLLIFLLPALLTINILFTRDKIKDLEAQLGWATGKQKIEVLLRLISEYKTINPQKVIEKGMEALKLLKNFPDEKQEIRVLNNIGGAYIDKGMYETGLAYLNRGRKQAEEFGYRQGLSDALYAIGTAYCQLSNYDLAMMVNSEVLEIRNQLGDQRGIAESHRGIGKIYSAKGDFDKALEKYWHALDLQEKINDKQGIANTYLEIGGTYRQLKKVAEAEHYYKEALELHKKLENKLGILLCLNNIVTVLKEKGENALENHLRESFYLETLKYYQQALKIHQELGYKTDMVLVLSNMAGVYEALKEYQKAGLTYEKSLNMAKDLGEKSYEAHVLINISIMYNKWGKYEKALGISFQALEIAAELPSKLLIKRIYETLSDIYANKGDYKNAYEYHRKFKTLGEEVLDAATNKRIAEMETQLNMKEKEIQIALLKEKEKRQKNLLRFYLVVGILILIIAVINYLLYRYKKRAETTVRESEEKYRQLVERANDGIAVIREGVFKYFNPRLIHLLGYSLEEMTGLPFEQVLSPGEKQRVKEILSRRMKGNKGGESYETVLVHKDGTRIEVEIIADGISYENRLAKLVFIHDIRGQKQLAEERMKRSKLESIGMLAGGIAHDFNNLLGVIMGYIELGKMGLSPGSPHMNSLSKADRAVMKARDLAQQFLTFSEGGAPVKRVSSLLAIVKKAVDHTLSHPDLPPKIIDYLQEPEIKINIPADLWLSNCDPDQITQVISQLVINSAEAMHTQFTAAANDNEDNGKRKGPIEIIAENMIVESQQFGYLQPGKYTRLSIRDRGEGIKREYLPKIFDPYFSTRDRVNQKGLGLGLTLVYSIIKRHNGHIDVNSKVGKGTIVTIYLPALN